MMGENESPEVTQQNNLESFYNRLEQNFDNTNRFANTESKTSNHNRINSMTVLKQQLEIEIGMNDQKLNEKDAVAFDFSSSIQIV